MFKEENYFYLHNILSNRSEIFRKLELIESKNRERGFNLIPVGQDSERKGVSL